MRVGLFLGDYGIGNSISFRLQPKHDSQQGLILFPTFLLLREQTLATDDADVKLVLLITFWELLPDDNVYTVVHSQRMTED